MLIRLAIGLAAGPVGKKIAKQVAGDVGVKIAKKEVTKRGKKVVSDGKRKLAKVVGVEMPEPAKEPSLKNKLGQKLGKLIGEDIVQPQPKPVEPKTIDLLGAGAQKLRDGVTKKFGEQTGRIRSLVDQLEAEGAEKPAPKNPQNKP